MAAEIILYDRMDGPFERHPLKHANRAKAIAEAKRRLAGWKDGDDRWSVFTDDRGVVRVEITSYGEDTDIGAAITGLGAKKTPNPKGDWALVKSMGMDDKVLSTHKTKAAAEKAMRKKGGEPDSMFQKGMRIVSVGPSSGMEVIPTLGGGRTVRSRNPYLGDAVERAKAKKRKTPPPLPKPKRKNPITISTHISAQDFDALGTGQRICIGVSSMFGGGEVEREFEVGRSSYSKKYDVRSKRLYPVYDGTPKKTGAKWILMKRASGNVGLAHGDMAARIHSFRTANPGKKRTKKPTTSKIARKRKNPSVSQIMRDAMK